MKKIFSEITHFYRTIEDHIPGLGKVSKCKFVAYSAVDFIVHGIGPSDYLLYEFWRKSNWEKRTFLAGKRFRLLQKVYNNSEKVCLFRDKRLFNKTFSIYIKRSWLYVNECSINEFNDFIDNHKTIFIKPVRGATGKGIRILSNGEINDDNLFEKLKKENVILEEKIMPGVLSEFNKGSCTNSLRIVTLLYNGKPYIKCAVLKMAFGNMPVDNLSSGGIAAVVDVDTGVVISQGIDINKSRYIKHPQTGKQIVGYKIPMWGKIVDVVKGAAGIVPEIRHVGWDVTINKNGEIVIIEGNHESAPGILQEIDQIGKRKMFYI